MIPKAKRQPKNPPPYTTRWQQWFDALDPKDVDRLSKRDLSMLTWYESAKLDWSRYEERLTGK